MTEPTAMTPPAIARKYGVKPEKVLAWIRAGELAAVNVATRPYGRPRWVVSAEALATFEARRTAQPPAKPARRRKVTADAREWF